MKYNARKKIHVVLVILLSIILSLPAITINESLKNLENDPLSANNFKQYAITSTRYLYKSAEGDCSGRILHEEKISNILECEKWCNDVELCSGYSVKTTAGGIHCRLKSAMGLDNTSNKIQNCKFIKPSDSDGWSYFAADKNSGAITLDTPVKNPRPNFWGIASH